MEKISFNKFRTETHHKKVKYQFRHNNGKIIENETDKFYCNPCGDTLSIPKMVLGKQQDFFKISETEYLAKSQFGETTFSILAGVME